MLQAILFDFDGVLIDSYDSTIEYIQKAFRQFHLSVPTRETLLPLLGLRMPDVVKKLLGDEHKALFDKFYPVCLQLSIAYASKIPLTGNTKDVVKELSGEYKLALVTNRGTATVDIILKTHAIRDSFSSIITRDDVREPKPHPEGILKTLKRFQLRSQDAIYVGDTIIDSDAAENAHLRSIIISPVEIIAFGDYHIQTISELPTFLKRLLHENT